MHTINTTVTESKPAVPVPVSMDLELDDIETPKRGGSGRKIEEKTLDEYGFITGDLLSVSLYIPEPKIPAGLPRLSVSAGVGAGAMGVGGVGLGTKSFGWGEKPREVEIHPSERSGAWQRGEAVPPQNFRGGAAGAGKGGEPGGGGSWRGGLGMGMRGAGGRSPEKNGRRRSRSPEGRDRREGRRESWSRRRGD